jgi:hypothetical protein
LGRLVEPDARPMILFRFLKQQNWWYGIPSVIFLTLLHYLQIDLAWSFVFATGFLVSYGLKFSDKNGNDFTDILRLILYFIYITAYILSMKFHKSFHFVSVSILWFIFFSYFYSILLTKKIV